MRGVKSANRVSVLNAVVAASVGGSDAPASASTTQHVDIIQRNGHTAVHEHRSKTRSRQMAENTEIQEQSEAELDAETGEELPDREAMSLIIANVAAPVNLAAALNVASDNSVAYANATQTAPITQST